MHAACVHPWPTEMYAADMWSLLVHCLLGSGQRTGKRIPRDLGMPTSANQLQNCACCDRAAQLSETAALLSERAALAILRLRVT